MNKMDFDFFSPVGWKPSDEELHKAARAAVGKYPAPKQGFKEFIGATYKIPAEILASHRANFAPDPAPLSLVCPSGGYKVTNFSTSVVDAWYDQIENDKEEDKDDPDRQFEVIMDTHLCYVPLTFLAPFWDHYHGQMFESSSMPKPDLFVYTLQDSAPVMPLVIDMENLMGAAKPPSVVLDRMFQYLRLTGTWIGVLTCIERSWVCKRGPGYPEQVLSVSGVIDAPGKAMGYALHCFEQMGPASTPRAPPSRCSDDEILLRRKLQARLQKQAQRGGQSPHPIIASPLPSASSSQPKKVHRPAFSLDDVFQDAPPARNYTVDVQPLIEKLREACSVLELQHSDDIIQGATETRFDISDLKNATKVQPIAKYSSLVTLRGTYKGTTVVVKVRDLTMPWWDGLVGSLKYMAREIDTYMCLRNVCTKFAKLLSWGFTCGGMFAFVMLSDEGRSQHDPTVDQIDTCPAKVAALSSVKEALYEMHKRGILHGDINRSKVVLKPKEGGEWVAKLVGFAEARLVDRDSFEGSEALAGERVRLHVMLKEFAEGPDAESDE